MVQGGKPDHSAFWRDALGHIAQPEVRASPSHLSLDEPRHFFPVRDPQLPLVPLVTTGPAGKQRPESRLCLSIWSHQLGEPLLVLPTKLAQFPHTPGTSI